MAKHSPKIVAGEEIATNTTTTITTKLLLYVRVITE